MFLLRLLQRLHSLLYTYKHVRLISGETRNLTFLFDPFNWSNARLYRYDKLLSVRLQPKRWKFAGIVLKNNFSTFISNMLTRDCTNHLHEKLYSYKFAYMQMEPHVTNGATVSKLFILNTRYIYWGIQYDLNRHCDRFPTIKPILPAWISSPAQLE